jgi:peroxiredoxin
MAIKIGQTAPEFSLFDTEKKEVKLSDFKGKNVVVLFIPAAFTSTCTKEFCAVRDELTYYNNLNAQVLGISVDMLFTLGKFKEEQNYNFPLLSDFNKEASTAYEAIYENWIFGMKGVSKRSSFVIDKDGIVRFAEVLENANDFPNLEGIKETLKNLN